MDLRRWDGYSSVMTWASTHVPPYGKGTLNTGLHLSQFKPTYSICIYAGGSGKL